MAEVFTPTDMFGGSVPSPSFGGSLADRVISGMMNRARPAVDTFINDVFDDLTKSIATAYPPASEPSQPPHRRTGGYLATIRQDVLQDTRTIIASAFTESPLGLWLEEGTVRMAPRPHFAPCFERWRSQYLERINNALSQG